MSNRSRSIRRRSRLERCTGDHGFELWCLGEAVQMGTWCAAGLNREVVNGEVAGYWMVRRCGCVLVVMPS
jgi:hypothetical protein